MQPKHHFRMPRTAMMALLALGFCGLAATLALLGTAGLERVPAWQLMALAVGALAQAALLAALARSGKRAAAAAAQSAAMYRFLADHAMDLITRHSSDGRIRFASPAALALLGRSPETVLGLAPADLVAPDDLPALNAALMESSYFGRAASAEVRLRQADGALLWAEIRCRPVSEGGDIVAVTRDISERKRHDRALVEARDAALDASRAKSRFLANMSHELRTPLNAIIGFSEMMTREMFGEIGPRYQEYSRLIHESGSHLLDLINSVLDMSKIEAGKFELAEELFNLQDVAESAVRFLKVPAERAGVALVLDIAPPARLAFADRRAVKQILVNLLSNGVKYTPPGGEVRITARIDHGLEIVVRDTGTGISAIDLERLGKPFEQVESAETRGKEGTGLGLALVKAMTLLHGGEATIASALGEGTVVTVRLPNAAVDAQGQPVEGEKPAGMVLPFRAA
jgi:cell cycle sensor histidine kinase DivJ